MDKKSLAKLIIAGIMVTLLITACGMFGELDELREKAAEENRPSGPSAPAYTIKIEMSGNKAGDAITPISAAGNPGDIFTFTCTVTGGWINNSLSFSGVDMLILPVANEVSSVQRSYLVNADDATNGIITIQAIFDHNNLQTDTIAFANSGPMDKEYGDAPFTNPIGSYNGGTVSYSSSNEAVATVSNTGEVTILKIGVTTITANKTATVQWAPATVSYELKVSPATPSAPAAPRLVSRSSGTITINAPASYNTLFELEYCYSTSVTPSGPWEDKTTFTGLNNTIAHYFFCRYKANPEKNNISSASPYLLVFLTDGAGTEGDPYKIYDAATLQKVGKDWALSAHYRMYQDIDMTGETFTPIPNSFSGTFDGGGFAISNLNVIGTGTGTVYTGMFSHVYNGKVQNLGLVNCSVSFSTSSGTAYTGGLVGYLHGTGIIENCYFTGTVTANGGDTGGLVGYNLNGTIANCHVAAAISGYNSIGGVVGSNATYSTVQYCYATGTVTTTAGRAGGIAGTNSGMVKNCYTAANVTATVGFSCYTGGVTGLNMNNGTIQNCYATGNVKGYDNTSVGGVVGSMDTGIVQNCYATGSVDGGTPSGTAVGIGGITGGYSSGTTYIMTIRNCVALNSRITTTSTNPDTIGRVVREKASNCTLQNNHGLSVMDIRYGVDAQGAGGTNASIFSTAGSKDGVTATASATLGFWTPGNWYTTSPGFAWDFTNDWEWSSSKSRPILRGVGGNQ